MHYLKHCDFLRQLSTNNHGVSAGSQQVVKCVKTLARPRAPRSDLQARMEDEMRRHKAEMDMYFEEVRRVFSAAVSWKLVLLFAFISSDVAP